jgi:cysteine desulfurase/selenocysteine lyase
MAQAAGLAAAIGYLNKVGMDNIHRHEIALTQSLLSQLSSLSGVTIVGPVSMENRGGSISFTVDGVHPHDLGQFLDNNGIAVRTGHHCAWPLNKKMGVQSTTRASLYLYNTEEDLEALVSGIADAQKYFGR